MNEKTMISFYLLPRQRPTKVERSEFRKMETDVRYTEIPLWSSNGDLFTSSTTNTNNKRKILPVSNM